MGYYYGSGSQYSSSIFDAFTLSPLPYPVLLLLMVVLLPLGFSWFFSYEEIIESAEEQMSWVLFVIPVLLIILIRCLSSFETPSFLYGYDRRKKSYYSSGPQEGSSPWGVAAFVVLLLVLAMFQPSFNEMWFH